MTSTSLYQKGRNKMLLVFQNNSLTSQVAVGDFLYVYLEVALAVSWLSVSIYLQQCCNIAKYCNTVAKAKCHLPQHATYLPSPPAESRKGFYLATWTIKNRAQIIGKLIEWTSFYPKSLTARYKSFQSSRFLMTVSRYSCQIGAS